HVNNKISEWEIDHLSWIEFLNRQQIKINLVVHGDPQYETAQDKITFVKLSHNFKLFKGRVEKISEYKEHLTINRHDGKYIGYISDTDYAPLTDEWAKNPEINYYKIEVEKRDNLRQLGLPDFEKNKYFESRIEAIPRGSLSGDLAELFLENLSDKKDFLAKIKNHKY